MSTRAKLHLATATVVLSALLLVFFGVPLLVQEGPLVAVVGALGYWLYEAWTWRRRLKQQQDYAQTHLRLFGCLPGEVITTEEYEAHLRSRGWA